MTHEDIQDWMNEEGIVLVRHNDELTFMWAYDAEHLSKHNINDHSIDLLRGLIKEYLENEEI